MKTIMCAAAVGCTLLPLVPAFGGYRVLPAKTDVPYAKVEALAPVGMSLTNGVMYKHGRPHFWIGNGDADAASQHGHFGVWLAWLQGADANRDPFRDHHDRQERFPELRRPDQRTASGGAGIHRPGGFPG